MENYGFIKLCYGVVGSYMDTSKMTVDEVVKEFLRHEGVSSIEEYKVKQQNNTYGNLKKEILTTQSKDSFLIRSDSNIKKSFGIKTLNDYLGVQKSVLKTLSDEGFFSNNRNIITNKSSGIVVEITKDGIKETLGPGMRFEKLPRALKELKLSTIRSLPALIESAHLDKDNVPNDHNPRSKLTYAYLSKKITLDNGNNKSQYVVSIGIRKSTEKNKFWMHEIRTKKKDQ